MIVLVLISLLAGPVWSNLDEDEHLETVLAVTQCRASCLDQVEIESSSSVIFLNYSSRKIYFLIILLKYFSNQNHLINFRYRIEFVYLLQGFSTYFVSWHT